MIKEGGGEREWSKHRTFFFSYLLLGSRLGVKEEEKASPGALCNKLKKRKKEEIHVIALHLCHRASERQRGEK